MHSLTNGRGRVKPLGLSIPVVGVLDSATGKITLHQPPIPDNEWQQPAEEVRYALATSPIPARPAAGKDGAA